MNTFESIESSTLSTVSGGSLLGKIGKYMQQGYKWYTGSEKAGTPQEINRVVKEVGGGKLLAGGAAAAGYAVGQYNGGQPSTPTPTSSFPGSLVFGGPR
ncbi:MAG: hypothetical protein ACKV2T_39420 [Kofleriaceae bacterium]